MDWGRSNAAGLDGGWVGLDGNGSGVLAVLINDGGALSDGVGLGADAQGGGAWADGGKTLDGGGGVGRVLRGLGADGVASRRGDSWVRGVLRSLAGLVGRRGNAAGGVVSRVGVGVDSGSEASDDSEGAHLDCWVDY